MNRSDVDASNVTVVHGSALHLLGVGDLDGEVGASTLVYGVVDVIQEPEHVLAFSFL